MAAARLQLVVIVVNGEDYNSKTALSVCLSVCLSVLRNLRAYFGSNFHGRHDLGKGSNDHSFSIING